MQYTIEELEAIAKENNLVMFRSFVHMNQYKKLYKNCKTGQERYEAYVLDMTSSEKK